MRTTVRPLLLAGAFLLPVTGVAIAQDTLVKRLITCQGGSCEGTEKADLIVAGNDADEVFAKGGDDDIELDLVFVGGSNDVAYGGDGRDCIDGGGGDDLMLGGPGDDNRPCEFSFFVNIRSAMTGGPGNDRMEGGPGNDSIDGIFGDDLMMGDEGDDLIEDYAQRDRDRLLGGPGKDTLSAKDGDGLDVIDGGPGTDGCTGDPGDTFVNCEIGTTRTSPSGDTTRPEAEVTGVPARGCTRKAFTARVNVHDTGGLASIVIRRDTKVLATKRFTETADATFTVRVPVAAARPGRRLLTFTATDDAGNSRVVRRAFTRCAARKA